MTRARRHGAGNGGELEPGYWFAKGILRPSLGVWFRFTSEGVEHIPKKGPALIAFNHIAYFDPLAAAYVIDKAGRRPRFLGKAELFRDKKVGWILRGAGQIPVERGTKDAPAALDASLEALGRGEVIVIFPEGTITRNEDLSPMEAKSGMARLALKTGLPVIPGALWGTQNIWAKGCKPNWRRGQDICVRLGPPIELSGDPESPAAWEQGGLKVMDAISTLVASLRPIVPDRRQPRRKDVA